MDTWMPARNACWTVCGQCIGKIFQLACKRNLPEAWALRRRRPPGVAAVAFRAALEPLALATLGLDEGKGAFSGPDTAPPCQRQKHNKEFPTFRQKQPTTACHQKERPQKGIKDHVVSIRETSKGLKDHNKTFLGSVERHLVGSVPRGVGFM